MLTFFPWNLLPSIHNIFYDNSVLETASFEDNDCDNSPLATLITIKDTFFHVYHQVFCQFAEGFMELFSAATFEPF
jgi:hypothetical protein